VGVRVCLYGDVDLNLVDGSAIWLAAFAQTLALDAGCAVTIVPKAALRRDVVVADLRGLDNVAFADEPAGRERSSPAQAFDVVEDLDRRERFDVVAVRGFAAAKEAAARPSLTGRLWVYLTDVPQAPWLLTDQDRDALGAIARASQRLLCQTEELRAYLEGVVPDAALRTALLPPMVPVSFLRPSRPPPRPARLFYAGKFAPAWGFLETVAAFTRLREVHPDLELHVAGDKVHDPKDDPDFKPAVQAALTGTDGLVWHGAVSRAEVADLLAGCTLALSARDPSMDASLELSTKLLEYGAANVPMVLNRTAMHERLLGGDYPLFVDRLDDLPDVIGRTLDDVAVWETARDAAHAAVQPFTMPAVRERIAPLLAAARPQGDHRLARHRVVIAGHDLKFSDAIAGMLERAGAEVRRDRWRGHIGHDREQTRAASRWAEAVWAEWCLGNAVWYSRHKRDGQRLVVRLHLQELDTDFPGQLDADAVDHLVCVADFMVADFQARHAWPEDRVSMVPNAIDTIPFDRPKLPGAEFTLGMVGILPMRKRFDLAVDLLEALLEDDPRWRLRVAGSTPWTSPWVWDRLDERRYFEAQLDRVRRDPRLAAAVRFDGRVGNIPGWFAGVGNVVSLSDFESFHLGLAEGLASRCVPVVLEREGVRDIFPGVEVHADIAAAARWLRGLDGPAREAVGGSGRDLIVGRYDLTGVAARWIELLLA
jgi:glycosyltransferase involved in cell wall biosynthesis